MACCLGFLRKRHERHSGRRYERNTDQAPDVAGEIYIDHLLTAAKMDHRYQTADLQVPFVNKETGNHWLFALKYSRLTPDIPLEATVSNTQKQEIEIIEKRLREIIVLRAKLPHKQ